jgi:hypothetical protein
MTFFIAITSQAFLVLLLESHAPVLVGLREDR